MSGKIKTTPSSVAASSKTAVQAKSAQPAKSPVAAKPSPQKKTVFNRKPDPSTEFTLVAPEAKDVFLAGEFNNWNVSEHRMRRFKDGVYKKSLKLNPGRYEYLYIVDGNWRTDPNNSEMVPNSFGTQNSVINISKN